MVGLHYAHGLADLHVCLKRTGTFNYCLFFRSEQVLLRFDTLCDGLSRWSGQNGSRNGDPASELNQGSLLLGEGLSRSTTDAIMYQ